MCYAYLRRVVARVKFGLLLLLIGSAFVSGPDRVVAQRAITPEEEAWIQTAVSRTTVDGDAERAELAGCLRARISTGTDRFDALATCYERFQLAHATPEELAARLFPEVAREAAAQFGAPELSYEEFVQERQRLINERTAQLLGVLPLWGATPEEIDALRGPLTACLAAWATVNVLVIVTDSAGQPVYRFNEDVTDVCAEDLPAFGRLRRTAPLIRSLGCPDLVIQERPFACVPEIEGNATIFSWTIGGGASANDRNASLTAGTAGPATISLLVCNGEPDPATAGNCAESSRIVTVEPRAPVVGSPGCPATAARGQAVNCTPTGVSNTSGATRWGWTATGAELANDGLPVLTVTFTTGGVQTVTVVACNTAQSCSAPVSQAVTVTGSPGNATIRVDKPSYQANEAIQYCFTVPGPGPVRFTMTFPIGQARVLIEGVDDGRGDCLTDRVLLPQGQSPTSGCIRLEFAGTTGGASAQACFSITGTASTTGGTSGACPGGYSGTYRHLRNILPAWGALVLRVSGNTVTGTFDTQPLSGTLMGDTIRATAGRFTLEIRLGWTANGSGELIPANPRLRCISVALKADGRPDIIGRWFQFERSD